MYSNKKFYLSDSNSNIQKSYLTVVESLMLEILEKFFLQNLFMSSIFKIDYHGKKESTYILTQYSYVDQHVYFINFLIGKDHYMRRESCNIVNFFHVGDGGHKKISKNKDYMATLQKYLSSL